MPMPLSLMWNSKSAKSAGAVSFCTIHRLICPPSGVNFTAYNIDQDLFKPQRVGNDILVFHANGIEGKGKILFGNTGLHDIPEAMHQLQ